RIFVASMFPGSFGIAPAMITQPVSGGVYRGGTAILSPRVRGDTNNLTYQWQKNGVALSDGGKVSGSSTASLTITKVGSSDAASYTLVVTNAFGSVTSSVAALSVVHPPTGGYAYVIYTNKPITYWRLNENVNPATNAATYDYITGGAGFWGQNAI